MMPRRQTLWPRDRRHDPGYRTRLQALRDQKGVALGMMGDMSSGANMYSCEDLAKRIQETQPWLLQTDRAIVSDRIANSGKSLAELVEKYRERSPSLFK